MPTGYTSDIYDGKDLTFRAFALRCARAFGATIHQRDQALDVELTPREPAVNYHDKELARQQAMLDEATAWTLEEAEAAAAESHGHDLAQWREHEAEISQRRERYEQMIDHVTAWTPPTEDHLGLKEFMLNQLRESMDFDCSGYARPTHRTGTEFREAQIARATRSIEHHKQQRADEIERASGANAWVDALVNSLPTAGN